MCCRDLFVALCVACCTLFVVWGMLFVARCMLFVVWCMLRVVWCRLFVVWCVLLVAVSFGGRCLVCVGCCCVRVCNALLVVCCSMCDGDGCRGCVVCLLFGVLVCVARRSLFLVCCLFWYVALFGVWVCRVLLVMCLLLVVFCSFCVVCRLACLARCSLVVVRWLLCVVYSWSLG